MDKWSIVSVTAIVLLVLLLSIIRLGSQTEVQIRVKDKERIAEYEGGRYLIFTDNEVFENTDELLRLKFNSSDIYNQLELGQSYSCTVLGWRIPFLSWYRNIISCKKIN